MLWIFCYGFINGILSAACNFLESKKQANYFSKTLKEISQGIPDIHDNLISEGVQIVFLCELQNAAYW